jgi:holliday junction resolvase Hjr
MSKSKGSKVERDLIDLLWENGWAAIRSAGSGSMHYPSPDVLTSNRIRKLAIEVKATKDNKKYFPKDEIKQLLNFCNYFGAEGWLAIKFNRKEFIFINPEDLQETNSNFVFHIKNYDNALSFKELIQ